MNTNAEHQATSRLNRPYAPLILAILLIMAGLAMLFWMYTQSSSNISNYSLPENALNGEVAPDFKLSALSGEEIALTDYQGQVVLINLWATWCIPCKAEMPTLDAFYRAHKEEGFVVLAVNNQEGVEVVHDFVQAEGFTFPVLLDPQADIIELYQVRGLPTTFIIDRDGYIQHVQLGEISKQQLETIISPLL